MEVYLLGCLLLALSYGGYADNNTPTTAIPSDLFSQMKDIVSTFTEMCLDDCRERKSRARDCSDLQRKGHVTSGVYAIFPDTLWQPLWVYCDMTTDGGGWTVFQRRCDGTQDFYRTWNEYRFGFGDLTAEFWLGNEYMHRIMKQAPQEMRIELEDFEKDRRYVKYGLFEIGSAADLFRLHVEEAKGNVTDSLIHPHNDRQFSAHNKGPSSHCARAYKGGFWYANCHNVNINGLYLNGTHSSYADGVNWYGFRGYRYSLKFTEMKFRPKMSGSTYNVKLSV